MSCLRPSTPLFLSSGAWILTGLAAAACVFNPLWAAEPRESPPLEFNRDIRPILSENCFACHGPDKNARQADLRLDRRDEAVARGAIKPGDLEGSKLVARIRTDQEMLRMLRSGRTRS